MEKLLNDILLLLCRAISNRRLYFNEHPKVVEYSNHFMKLLVQFFKESEQDELFIGIIDGNFIFEGKKLIGPSVIGKQFVLIVEMLKCGGIGFNRELNKKSLGRFLNLTSQIYEPVKDLSQARALLVEYGVEGITLSQSYQDNATLALAENKATWAGKDMAGLLESPSLAYQALFDLVSQAHGSAALDRSVDLDNARAVSEFMLQFIHAQFSDVMQHIHYPDYDSYTIGHSVRVAALAVHAGASFKWDDKLLLDMGTAALMHDIGKSKIAGEILHKPGKFTLEEKKLMEHHSRMGAEILLSQEGCSPLDVAAAWGHHLRYDGGGYPEQPDWAVTHPVTWLFQICDVFEALTAIRPYKQAMSPHNAYAIMLRDKGAFHPRLLASFIGVVGLYPPGTVVELTTGETALVTRAGKKIDKPSVRVIRDEHGETIVETDRQRQLDLDSADGSRVQVRRLILDYIQEN